MKKGIRLIKRMVALVLVLLLSIESFAAVVSDNDGSAFITKGEFDSLKNSFQSQIDQYNTSIDSKIDGAIASYLAGLTIEKEATIDSYWNLYNKTASLRFWNKSIEYNEMTESDLYYQWCCLFLWSNVQLQAGPNYDTHVTDRYSSMNFWSPLDCNDARKYRLKSKGDINKYLITGERVALDGNEYFLVDNNSYKLLRGLVSVFGANINASTMLIRDSYPNQKLVWPNFSVNFRTYTSNAAFLYNYTIAFKNWDSDFSTVKSFDIDMPSVVTLNWNTDVKTNINPCFDFYNSDFDLSKNIMTLDNDSLVQWDENDEIREPYSESGGEIWIGAQRPTSTGQSGTFPVWRNYFGKAWGLAPPKFYGWNSNGWDISWESEDDNYISYKRPKVQVLNVDKIINSIAYSITDLKVKSYEGMPILRFDKQLVKLNCELDVHIYDYASGNELNNSDFYFIVSKNPFTTVSSSTIISSGETEEIKYFSLKSGKINKVNFDSDWISEIGAKSYLYGRIYPVTANSYATANITSMVGTSE